MRRALLRTAISAAAAALVLLASCGGDGESGATTSGQAGPVARGEALAESRGCQSCHSTDGATRVGPTWEGLAGSEVTLDDGTTVVADTGYLRRSITDPGAQRVEGSTVQMPTASLTDDEVDDLVAYIESLSG